MTISDLTPGPGPALAAAGNVPPYPAIAVSLLEGDTPELAV